MELALLIMLIVIGPLAIASGANSAERDTRLVEHWWPGVRS
jgi:hypothetical protein